MKYIQLKRTKGYKKPENTVVVSRPTKYGNPFRIGHQFPMELNWSAQFMGSLNFTRQIKYSAGGKIEDAAEAVELFERYLKWLKINQEDFFAQMITDLKGKNLACWCKTGKTPCHAKILLQVVNL